jgi:hypothetical protein
MRQDLLLRFSEMIAFRFLFDVYSVSKSPKLYPPRKSFGAFYGISHLKMALLSIIANLVDQSPNVVNLDRDLVAILQHNSRLTEVANASRGSRQEESASFQCSTLREIRNLFLDREDHILGMAVLDRSTVVNGLDGQGLGVFDHRWCDQNGPYNEILFSENMR